MQFALYFAILIGWTGIPFFQGRLAMIVAPAAITAVLFLFALFQQLALGILVVKVTGLVLLAYTLFSAFRCNEVRKRLLEICLAFLFVFYLSFLASDGMNYFAWDEFSHWGAQVEYLLIFGELPQSGDILLFPDYIPGLSLWRYFARIVLFDFGPAAAYFSGWIIVFSCFFVATYSLKKWRFFAACLALYLLFVVFFQSLVLTLYADQVQAALLMAGLVFARETRFSKLALIPVVVLLVLSKHVGIIFCCFIFLYYIARQCLVCRRSVGETAPDIAAPFLVALTLLMAWKYYVEIHQLSRSVVEFGKILSLNFNEISEYIFNIFFGLLNNKFPHAYWHNSSLFSSGPPQINLWEVIVSSLAMAFVFIWAMERPREEKKIDFVFVALCVLLYIIFLTFIRATTPWIGDQWSFTRYLSVVLFAMVSFIIPDLFSKSGSWRLMIVIATVATISTIYSPTPKDIFGVKSTPLFDINKNFERKARSVLSQVGSSERLWYIFDENNIRDYFVFRMKVIPVNVEIPHFGWNIYLNFDAADWPKKSERLKLFAKKMCSVDVLFIDNVADFFWEDYAELFDKPKGGQMFRVRKDVEGHCSAFLIEG